MDNLRYSNWNKLYSNNLTYHTYTFNLCLRVKNGISEYNLTTTKPSVSLLQDFCTYFASWMSLS